MRKGGGRSKGNANERKIAGMIVKAFRKFGIKGKDCYRTPSSGGHKYAKKEDPGDLVISKRLRRLFPFAVEAKHYKKVRLFPLWYPEAVQKKAWKYKGWLEQACAACKRRDTHPMLVWKENNGPFFVALPFVAPLVPRILESGDPYLRMRFRGEDWYVVLFDRLLEIQVRLAKEV